VVISFSFVAELSSTEKAELNRRGGLLFGATAEGLGSAECSLPHVFAAVEDAVLL
jgi:hypothetical protein